VSGEWGGVLDWQPAIIGSPEHILKMLDECPTCHTDPANLARFSGKRIRVRDTTQFSNSCWVEVHPNDVADMAPEMVGYPVGICRLIILTD
jgi:hypothetical protein